MNITIKLLKPFSDIAGKNEVSVDLQEGDVNSALLKLCDLFPKMRPELFEENGDITYFVNIFLNDKPITALENVETKLSPGDELLLFLPVGGG